MHVYILHNNTVAGAGGVEQVVRNVLERLPSELQKRVTVLYSNTNPKIPEPKIGDVKFVNLSVPKYGIWDKLFLRSQRVLGVRAFSHLKNAVEPGDVINVHGTEYGYTLSKRRQDLPEGVRLILSVHGSYFQQYTDFIVKRLPSRFVATKTFFYLWRWYAYFLERAVVAGFDRYVYICEANRSFYETKLGASHEKGSVIYNGCVLGEKYKRTNKKSGEPWKAVLVGSTYYLKGVDIALAAIERVRNAGIEVELNIVGIPDLAKHCPNLPAWVNHLGVIPPSEVIGQYRNSDFLLFPSRFEGFPLSMLEAVQEGLPVIASRVCKFDEVDPGGRASITCDSYSPHEYAAAISRLLTEYATYHAGASEIDLAKFDWKITAERYTDLLSSD